MKMKYSLISCLCINFYVFYEGHLCFRYANKMHLGRIVLQNHMHINTYQVGIIDKG